MASRTFIHLALCASLAMPLTTIARAHDDHAAGQPARGATTTTRAVVIVEHADGKMDFSPDTLRVKRGDTVRFDVTNGGKAKHEFRIDTVAGNAKHKAMMAEMPGMTHHEGNSIALDPGAIGHLDWTFTRAGTFQFACLIPGHYEAGMHGMVMVER